MMLSQDTRSGRVKFIYNAQFPADTVVELNNPHFISRQGRRSPLATARLILHGPLIHYLL
jgi:hypothetical protein